MKIDQIIKEAIEVAHKYNLQFVEIDRKEMPNVKIQGSNEIQGVSDPKCQMSKVLSFEL